MPALDGLRVIAAASVVIYHVMGATYGANPTAGVLFPSAAFLFFVISGYVIYRPFTASHLAGNAPPDLRRFYRSRVLRVLPLWWIAVAAYSVVEPGQQLHTAGQWIATLALLQYPWREIRYAVIGPAWALSVEWIFYLTAPLLALAVRTQRRRHFRSTSPVKAEAVVLSTLFVVAWLVPQARPFAALAAGMGFAVLDVHCRQHGRPAWLRSLAGNGWFMAAVTAASWLALAHYPYREGLSVQWVERDALVVGIWTATAIAWFLPIAFGNPSRQPQKALGGGRMAFLGGLTFGIYLWHQLVLDQVIDRLGRDGSFTAILYLTVLGTMVLALVSHVLVEAPIQRLSHPRRRAAGAGRAEPVDDAGGAIADPLTAPDEPASVGSAP